ncbi:MAG TPA: DUF502 domain-containing protein [Thermoanaerobaculia bacterium]|nr:DUF502 domain-containing protein [Thermoanaerobaculia bacterium]
MNFLVRNFLRGLAITVPIVVTVYVFYQAFTWIDQIIALPAPGLGFALTVAAVIAIGILASNFLVRSLLEVMERVFTRAPFIRIVYTAIKDLTDAFVGDRRKFNRPVLVRIPPSGEIKVLGFITRESIGLAGLDGHVVVYLPQSYNIAGNLLLLPAENVEPIAVDSSQLMTFIVSGGVSGLSPG